VTLLDGTLGAQLAKFGSWHRPRFTAAGIAPAVSLRTLWNSHVDATTLSGAARMMVRANCRKPMPKTSLISVVEDDRYFRDSMKRLMRSLGYNVETFSSAANFLASPRFIETTGLIADVHMPEMTGIELYKHLVEAGCMIPTILVTAYPDCVEHARALNVGVFFYLRKPVDEQHLIRCLRAALESGKPGEKNS
jgi:CheY-like chemotaxis protein